MLKDIYKKTMDIVFVNFLWIFTSLFGILLTAGAAFSAMFRVIYLIIERDEPTSVLLEFKKGFKDSFFKNTLVWVILLILLASIYFMYITSLANNSDILLILSIVGMYQWLIFFIYYFPIVALFKTKRQIDMVKNVIILSNINIWTNIKAIGSIVFILIIIFYVHPVFLVIAIGIYGYLITYHLRKILKPYYELWKSNELEEENA